MNQIYLVKNLEAAATTVEIQAAVGANKAFIGKDGAIANTAYTVTLPAGLIDGVYDLVAVDNAGNVSIIVGGWLTVDNTPPTVTIDQKAGQNDPTNQNYADFTAVFSEPVTGFTNADIDTTGSTVGGTKTITVTAVSTSVYTVRVAISGGGITDGIYKASVKANGAQDTAGNLNQASSSTDNSVTRDTVAPSLSMGELVPLDGATGVTRSGVISMVFNEPIQLGTGQFRIRQSPSSSIYINVPSADVVVNAIDSRIVDITYSGLLGNTAYNIRVDAAGVFKDLAGNDFPTLTKNNTWNFITGP